MQIDFTPVAKPDAAILAVPVAKDALSNTRWTAIGDGVEAVAMQAATAARFTGEAGAIIEVFVPVADAVRQVLFVGVGAGSDADWGKAGGAVTARLLTSGATSVTIDLGAAATPPSAAAAARFAAAGLQRAWRYDTYRTKLAETSKPSLTTFTIAGAPEGTDAAWAEQAAVSGGMDLTRWLVTSPPNIVYPESFVEKVTKDVEGLGLEITVLDEAQMVELGMGSLLSVSQGSRREARLLALKWNGAAADVPTLALVGKGVTFDSGGISIKPGAGMEDMKWDMGGAGAVAGAMKALAARKAKANVVGVMGLVENMPDGAALRPSDVITSMSGQTIEVLNTDAEGRLVLCDCVTWVQKTHQPATIVDLATLTGAMIVALGTENGGIFANDDALADQLLAAGTASGDTLWRFPLSPAYDKLIDSPIADMKNVGPRGAGSITAAQFIKRFVDEGVKWAHLDIAGMVWSDKPGTHHDKGATGYGVRLLDRFVADNFEG
ncbi:leucyl aminopeptidase [Sphingomonas sp. CFBP 13714]|uniref:leucyl aminopeptidase n=1 Tax=Sphingomonas sp. CFBP 13714 TaxID=2775308 RepID=UPI001785AEAD|nr:leucyl aminopeptidase [Sphingomonas sp. CFBP 13714]MBD8700888.1 leucyl aminopeptidase [Sphingomonas sp. CFBP 13714]